MITMKGLAERLRLYCEMELPEPGRAYSGDMDYIIDSLLKKAGY